MRRVRPITAQRLENVALHYLQRFASSSGNLRRVLMRRVETAARAVEDGQAEAVRAEGAKLVDALVARYLATGVLDDAAYAEMKARSLHRRGASPRAIRQKLALKGVDADTAEAGLARLEEETGDAETAAAVALARRRRLGPWRTQGRAEARAKDLAAMARAGFSWDAAAKVIDAETPEAAEELAN